jgi:hypothetical protein
MSDFFKHLAQLAITPLDQHHFVPGIVALTHLADLGRRGPHAAFPRFAALNGDTPAQALEFLLRRLPAYFYQIDLIHAGRGLGELVGQIAIVGH